MPVRRGHVAPRTTLIETIIRKFDTDSKYTISNWFYFITSTTLMCVWMADGGRWHSNWPANGVGELSSTFAQRCLEFRAILFDIFIVSGMSIHSALVIESRLM